MALPGRTGAIFRFVPDERGNITTKEPLLSCTDPHFRPSHIFLDPDGNLLVADWYGRDDESDMTGRIWRLKYVGKDRPKPMAVDLQSDRGAVAALGSSDHVVSRPSHGRIAEARQPRRGAAGRVCR